MDEKRIIQHTVYRTKKELIDTQYGIIPYLEWLEKEADRINASGDRITEIRENSAESVALFVDDVAERDGNTVRAYKLKKMKDELEKLRKEVSNE